jgi:AP endonuclease-2
VHSQQLACFIRLTPPAPPCCRESFWSCCQPKIGPNSGYAGVATLCKAGTLPISCEAGLTGSSTAVADAAGDTQQQKRGTAASGAGASNGTPASPLALQLSEELGLSLDVLAALDSEGRSLVTDHGAFVLVNLYGEIESVLARGDRADFCSWKGQPC